MQYSMIVGLAAVLLFSTDVMATTYYVDYVRGDDALAGTSEATAWKHAPGDENAVAAARAVTLVPGDTVLLKGGVTYRGSIHVPASGEQASPITYKGDGWGQGKAIVDGSAAFGDQWTRCASAEELRGNRNYRSIYYTTAPEGYGFIAGTYENSEFIYPSQDPTPSDPFHFDRIDQLRVIPGDDAAVSQTNSSITDPRHFTQEDPDYYEGASVLVWHQPNVTRLYKITGFDPATHTIRHEKVGGAGIYKGRNTYYAIINHPACLSGPGQYWLDQKTGSLYVWPRHGVPSDNEYSVVAAETGLNAGGRQHLVIEGFIVQKFVFGIRAGERGTSDVVIRNNVVRNLKSNDKYAIHAGGVNMKVINNRVIDCQRAVGILAGGKDVVIRGNTVQRTSRQGIWLMGAEHCQVVDNTVVEIAGTHSNGISLYLFSKDVLIAGNRILKTGSALTYHGNGNKSPKSEGLIIYNNLVDGAANSWGSNMGAVTIVNNTFLGPANVGGDSDRQVFVNNIVQAGGNGTVRSHNLYTALARWQKPGGRNTWSLADGEIDWSGKSRGDIFRDLAGGDYRLKPGSPALGSGADPTQYLPTALFPDYNFSKDIEGNPLARDGKWSIGAFGYGQDVAG
jgi:hypothetical protein